ncbi:MAG: glycosyltransferase [Desulfuromonadaceae bacterium]|nr:glycosyltransferase [Desulfuromonadaceae bacterium]
MQSKKICFFNSTRAWGGGEKWHFDIAGRLHNAYGNVFMVAGKGSVLGNRLAETAIPHYLVSIGNLSFLNVFKIVNLIRLFRKEQPDILIMNLPADLKAAGIAARLLGIKRIIYRRGSAIPVRNTLLNRLLFRFVIDEIIANSEETARTILSENPELFLASNIHVIYNGVDWSRFDSQLQMTVCRSQQHRIVLGNAGRMVPQKGQEILIQLAKQLKHKGYDFEMLIAGEGRLKESLLRKAVEEGVADRLRFMGFVENMPHFLNLIDIFLLPSLWEGFGYVIAEAMFCEKPVIAFNISSNPEIVSNNETGFLVEPGNVEMFLEKTELLINDVQLRQKMGQRARKEAVGRFSIQHTLAQIEQLLYMNESEQRYK